jgi:long-chain acyl-CoA synthetase
MASAEEGMNLNKLFLEEWKKADERDKVVDGEERLSFDALAKRSLLVAALLERFAGDVERVGMVLPNSNAFLSSLLGILLARKTAVPINFLLRPPEVASILQDSEVKLVLTATPFREMFDSLSGFGLDSVRPIYLDEIEEQIPQGMKEQALREMLTEENLRTCAEVSPEHLACLIYTSGTQGKFKGVMLSHRNLVANFQGCQELMGISQDDVFLCVLPTFHSFALTATTFLPLLNGARMVLMRRFNASQVLQLIEKERVTHLMLVPAMYGVLLKTVQLGKTNVESLGFCISGGGPLPGALEEAFEKATGKRLLNGYGLTEASPVISVNVPRKNKRGSIGPALPNVRVEIRGDKGEALPPKSVGEITVSGESVMMGYWNLPEESSEALTSDGWLRTGDLGYVDEEGFLFITGRKKDVIICGGENIYPMEIENVLYSHPAVEEVVVVGVKDEMRGEYPKGYVKLKENQGVSVQELRAFCRERLADYKVPREFQFIPEIPKSPAGKVLRSKLI